jgi:hypothetical protein
LNEICIFHPQGKHKT